MGKDKKPTNQQVALYLLNEFGQNIPDKKLREVAKKFNYKAKVLIRNYHDLVTITSFFDKKN